MSVYDSLRFYNDCDLLVGEIATPQLALLYWLHTDCNIPLVQVLVVAKLAKHVLTPDVKTIIVKNNRYVCVNGVVVDLNKKAIIPPQEIHNEQAVDLKMHTQVEPCQSPSAKTES